MAAKLRSVGMPRRKSHGSGCPCFILLSQLLMPQKNRNQTNEQPRYCFPLTATLFIAVAALALPLQAESKLQIRSPRNGTVVKPGETVTVEVSSSISYAHVVVAGTGPIGYSQGLTAPPFVFSIRIPVDITPGQYQITAGGVAQSGQLDSSEPISIDVERPDKPISLKLQPLHLHLSVGDKIALSVWGTYTDGSVVNLRRSSQITYMSESPSIATVTKDGWVTAAGVGFTKISVNSVFEVLVSVRAK